MDIIKALKDPKWAIKRTLEKFYIKKRYINKHLYSHKQLMNAIFKKFDENDYMATLLELNENKDLIMHIKIMHMKYGLGAFEKFDEYGWPATLYYIIRKIQPEKVVETGVFYGYSTCVILAALTKNNKGNLFSIDKPAYYKNGGYYDENPYKKPQERITSLPEDAGPGFLVPGHLKSRWVLILGDTKIELPKLLKNIGTIDMFLHDSLHSYENMIFEYNLAFDYLSKGGYLFSDNIDWNTAFNDFISAKNIKKYTYLAYYESLKLKDNFGVIIKN